LVFIVRSFSKEKNSHDPGEYLETGDLMSDKTNDAHCHIYLFLEIHIFQFSENRKPCMDRARYTWVLGIALHDYFEYYRNLF
jgi:hypothetical protein